MLFTLSSKKEDGKELFTFEFPEEHALNLFVDFLIKSEEENIRMNDVLKDLINKFKQCKVDPELGTVSICFSPDEMTMLLHCIVDTCITLGVKAEKAETAYGDIKKIILKNEEK